MNQSMNLTRRTLLGGVAASVAAPRIGRAQGLTKVKITLPWLAQGATAFVFIAKALGVYEKHGLDVEISRGYGSLAAAQAIAQKQFDFGIVSAGPMILASTRGIPLAGLATVNYDTTMGVLVRKDSPIKEPKDLAGKKIGSVITSAEYPFFPAYAQRAGFDAAKVNIIQMDNRILERSLIDGQVDAITGLGASSIPLILAQKVQTRFFSYSKAGIALYSNVVCTRLDVLKQQPDLCASVTAALLEAMAFQLSEPEKSLDLLIQEVPELGVTANGRESAALSQGLLQWTVIAPEAVEHGLGWSDAERWKSTVDLTMEYAVPAGAVRPPVDGIGDNRFVGKQKLSPDEWTKLKIRLAPYGDMLA